ncbi:hypothetical protein ACKWTF_000803 [Chironomus riparius]
MECEDKSMERQKLVQNDEEEDVTLPTSVTTQSKTPISPANVYSGSDSHSQSLGKTSSEAKLSFVNERKTIEIENARKASVERKKKMLKGFQDVKNMEKNLISLLDDFHNGKLRAFSGSSMNQMKNIRDQQEKLSKLHFDLGTSSNESKSSDHMAQLVQRLNEISQSIEKLNSSNVE